MVVLTKLWSPQLHLSASSTVMIKEFGHKCSLYTLILLVVVEKGTAESNQTSTKICNFNVLLKALEDMYICH